MQPLDIMACNSANKQSFLKSDKNILLDAPQQCMLSLNLNQPLVNCQITLNPAVGLDYRQCSVIRKYLVSDYGKIKHLEHC